MWICVCGETETRIWWREYAYLVMLGYGRDESAPTPGGLFVAHFTVCFVDISVCSPRIRNPFRIHSRNVRNVFVICVLHIRRVKVWFLRCKSMVFGVQKPPFYIAKTPFLKCNILNTEHGKTKWGIIYKVYCHRILMLNLAETRCSGIMVWCAFWFLDMANTLQNGV